MTLVIYSLPIWFDGTEFLMVGTFYIHLIRISNLKSGLFVIQWRKLFQHFCPIWYPSFTWPSQEVTTSTWLQLLKDIWQLTDTLGYTYWLKWFLDKISIYGFDFRKQRRSYHQGCTPKRTNIYIIVILAFTICFNIPSFWELRAVRVDNFQPHFENITKGINYS